MNKHISISLFRVSQDSKFLDMIFDCPFDFYFTLVELEVRTLGPDNKFQSQWFDLADVLFSDEDTFQRKHWNVRLPLAKIGISEPAIYIANFKAEQVPESFYTDDPNPEYTEISDCGELPLELHDSAVCSDVNDAYYSLLDYILDMGDKCQSVSDDALRNYLILYAHQSAMEQRDFEMAEMFFKMIIRKFNKCGGGPRPIQRTRTSSCNCGKR